MWENTIITPERKEIILFDTTLRDGHQCPWAAVESDDQYFDVIRWLDSIWINISEVWFPASSEHEAWRVSEVAKMARDGEISMMVCGLSQMVDFQVYACLKSLAPAAESNKAFFHIYFPVDPNLRVASIWNKVSNNQAVEKVAQFAKLATEMWMISQFSPEWYSRVWENFDFCTDLFIAAAENGITHFNCPDTIGGEDPDSSQKEYYVKTIMRHKAILDKIFPENNFVWSVHNHNDLWNAVQNSINGVKPWTWIHKIEWTINGIGERAWNADLIQVITRMKTTLSDIYNIDHIDATKIQEVSDIVANHMLPVQPNYPIVWKNASKHTSWWHTNAVINNPTVYQPFDPKMTWWEISMTYGPNSWGNLAIHILEKQWYFCPKENKRELDEYLKTAMQNSGRYKWITNEELLELYFEFIGPVQILNYSKVKWENQQVQIAFEWKIFWKTDVLLEWETVFQALKEYLSKQISGYYVDDYTSKSESRWSASQAVTEIIIIHNETWAIIKGDWKDADIETSSLKALANAFNTIYINENYKIIDSER